MSDPIASLNTALEGRYAIKRELGEGGMATVYLAEDLKHHREVALKVLKPELAALALPPGAVSPPWAFRRARPVDAGTSSSMIESAQAPSPTNDDRASPTPQAPSWPQLG